MMPDEPMFEGKHWRAFLMPDEPLTLERLEELFERCREDSNEVWPIIYPPGLHERVVEHQGATGPPDAG
jgi:hypothetical protein